MFRLIAFILLSICFLSFIGCDIDLSEQGSKDRALEEKANAGLKSRKNIFGDIIENVHFIRRSDGIYTFDFLKEDLEAQEVWDWTFRFLMIMDEENTAVATGRSLITVKGYMGKTHVVTGTVSTGVTGRVVPFGITLEGSYAGATIIEDWNPGRFRESRRQQ